MEKRKWLFKAVTAALLSVSAVGVAASVSDNTQPAQAASSAYSIKLTHNAYIYSNHGVRKGRKSLKKGKTFSAYGLFMINGKKYYRLSKGRFIKAANAIRVVGVPDNSNTAPTSDNKGKDEINKRPNNNNTNFEKPEREEKPTQQEIDKLLANSNDKLGYPVYFSDSQLAEVKTHLWSKIQSYRIENGYPAYKSNSELDSFINTVSSTTENMFLYADAINSADFEEHLPTLKSKGMNAIRSFDNYKYYGDYMGAPAIFNIKDRNPEHVATEIFNSLKADSYYNSAILGKNDKLSFGSLGLHYNWEGNFSTVGLVFIEVTGNSSEWTNYYNAN